MVLQRVVDDSFVFLRNQAFEDMNRGALDTNVTLEISYISPDQSVKDWKWKQKQIQGCSLQIVQPNV